MASRKPTTKSKTPPKKPETKKPPKAKGPKKPPKKAVKQERKQKVKAAVAKKQKEQLRGVNITQDTINLVWGKKAHVVRRGALNFELLQTALKREQRDYAEIERYLTVSSALQHWADGKFDIKGNRFMLGKTPMPTELNERILRLATRGTDPLPLFKFWEKLAQNPNPRSVEQTFGFLSHFNIPLSPDGYIIAYKKVKDDWTDCHSGTIKNEIGMTVTMERNLIDPNPNSACSRGLHIGSLSYATTFGHGRMLVVQVDPADICCVPHDCSMQKMRSCKYVVLGEYSGTPLSSNVYITDPEDLAPIKLTDEDYEEELAEVDEETDEVVAVPDPVTKEPQQVTNEVTKKVRKVIRKPITDVEKATAARWKKYDKMDESELQKVTVDDLRKYITQHLEIAGVRSIPGGKSGLIKAVIRQRTDEAARQPNHRKPASSPKEKRVKAKKVKN